MFQAKLQLEERDTVLKPLLQKGWIVKNEKDAIYKEFCFKDFNQVCSSLEKFFFHIIDMTY